MAYTITAQTAAEFFKNANAGTEATTAQKLTLQGIVNDYASGAITDEVAYFKIVDFASESTTAVSVGTYEFFLGFAPSEAGLASLNAAYVGSGAQANLNGENRFIAQSVSLALNNATAKAAFTAAYGSLSVEAAAKAAYLIIIGQAAADAKNINIDNAVNNFLATAAAQTYYKNFIKANIPGISDADLGLAVKAAIVGEILFQANKDAGIGSYATATTNLLKDLADDGHLVGNNAGGVDLFGSYGAGTSAGKTLVLTDGVDTLTGTTNADVFIADNTGATKVLSVADSIAGGGGIDTLKVYGSFGTTPQITGVENIIFDVIDNNETVSTASLSGVTDVTLIRAADNATVTVAAGTAVAIDTNQTDSSTLVVNYAASETTGKLTLSGVDLSNAGTLQVNGNKLATLNLAVSASSSIATLDGGAALKTIVATGAGDLEITAGLETSLTKLDATGLSGSLTVASTNNAATQDTATGGVDGFDITILGGSGDDSINVSASLADNEVKVDGGAGDDVVTIRAGTAYSAAISTNAGDSIVGGAGTDVLAVAGDLAASDMSGAISGFEVLRFTADAAGTDISATKLGITAFESTGVDTDVVLTGLAANSTFTINDDQSDLTAAIGVDTTADVLNVVLAGNGTATGAALTATNYETLNLTSSTDSASNANRFASISATSAKTVNISGATALTITTAALASGATVNASAATGNVTVTAFTTSVKSYVGSAGKDTITVLAGDLKQGNTFAGGAGTDVISATATSNQDLGIVGLTGFETLNLTTNGANVADLRNVTDLATLKVATTAPGDDLTLNRLSADTTLTFTTAIDDVVTTLQSGTTQKVAFTANVAVDSLVLDSGTTTLTITSDDGDANNDEAMGSFTTLSGTSLASIIVAGNDRTALGTLAATVTSVDASAAKGGLTVTASGTATTIIGSQAADTITGGAGDDVITGGKGADTLVGGAGHDTYVFAAKGADNGNDAITFTAGAGASSDVLKFTNFLAGGSVDQNNGAGTAIVAYTAGTNDVSITNKVALYADATEANIDTAAEIAALIQGAGNTFSLASGGKAILITGDTTGITDVTNIWYIDDSLDGVTGTVSASDVVLVGHFGANGVGTGFDLDTLISTNFSF